MNNITNLVDRNNISTLRQSARQRQSSAIAEMKFGNSNPLAFTNEKIKGKKSPFSQEMRMNRRLMNTARFTNENNIQDYTSSMYEIKRAA